VTRLEIVDEEPPGAQVAAADLEHPVGGLEAVADQIVELHLPEGEPTLV
jgi:hypothetical protein